MRRPDPLAAALLALSAAALLAGLDRFPALSADEAWLGMFASRLADRGVYTPHEMNSYTGPFYGWALSLLGAYRGGPGALRAPGALLNAAALFLGYWAVRRRLGGDAARWWAALAAGSAFFLLKSRLAWEVYALQPLLATCFWLLATGEQTRGRRAALAAVAALGVQNHFIFLSVPLSLFLLPQTRRGAFPGLAAGAAVVLVKPFLSEAGWASQRLWAVPLFLALPFAAARLPLPRLPELPRRAWAALAGASLLWHGPALWQALAGPVVWKRLMSWDAPWWLDAPLLAWSAALLGLAAWRAARAWHGEERVPAQERVTALWPLAYLAVLLAFRHTSSLRYYSLLHWLLLPAAACGLARLPLPDRRRAAALAAFAVLAVQGAAWREIASPADRRPLEFRVGWRRESSWDFARKDELFEAFDLSGACEPARPESSFTALPLFFRRLQAGASPCDPGRRFDAEFCRSCDSPPYYSWAVVGSGP